ncbi:hypothetical protein A1O1_04831 [Capronia coronata CBS 617.96]|uniref:UBC core domain-containing protein n=1 Tax=Capronia coronata CBS 617.96 TaxID=1182541 RepID=W9Z058_9EURO|nr:uncharacterized protein A1O1_04831 [Capronia coronata CBS 617.96]EXJ87904.1 hypothetical protein A1O1_04831 [Capronia coronata CBS 617.96]
MRALEINDHVAVKNDPSLYGTVQRTNTDSYEPLGDELIIAHTHIPPGVLNEFVVKGVPPEGYVFVQFADEAAGSSLVSEDDLILLSRVFQLGDTVKQDGNSMTGAVVNISESYTLEPITTKQDFARSLDLNVFESVKCSPECGSLLPPQFSHPNPHTLIHDVPSTELKRAQDLIKDDYIISGDWLGLADDVIYDVVIRLEDKSIVVVTGLDGLHIPVPDYGKPLVALPEPDGFKRPDVLVATQGWSSTIPVQMPRPGSFVIVDRTALRHGRWLEGSYNANCPVQGYVVDIRAHKFWVDWVDHNPVIGWPRTYDNSPPLDLYLYDSIRDPYERPGLRPKQNLCVYDRGVMPSKSAKQEMSGTEAGISHPVSENTQDVCPGQDIAIGVNVKFRDPEGAAVKYQGSEETGHGKFVRIPAEDSGGWDVNEFKVVYIKQLATVLWQDGSTTTVDSTLLEEYGLFESELAPNDIVLKREGMRQRPVGVSRRAKNSVKEFNEMTFFEQPHDLLPRNVGVVQSIDPNERIARVRWYKEPKIELRSSGQILSPHSSFGPIGDEIEDVSLYEIMSFPCLQRQRRDLCTIAPPEAANHPESPDASGTSATATSESASVQRIAGFSSRRSARAVYSGVSGGSNRQATDVARADAQIDWFGEIVAMGFDGSITVRLGAAQPCRDVRIEFDSIASLIADRGSAADMSGDMMDVDSWGDDASFFSDDESVEPISESIEYEGGERLDNDSGDDNWESDEDAALTDAHEEQETGDTEMVDAVDKYDDTPPSAKPQPSILQLHSALPMEPPPQFMVLDRQPPPDQFGLHSASTAGTFLKRIMREHRTLSTSLPTGEIYVRTYESRLDLLRCLIIGPRDTPYESAPFLIDLYLPEGYPETPPTAHFHSWTSGLGRINPNMYEEGKICLSLLGTWAGKNECESWSEKATILQLLVSLQGLVFVKAPFYNEAGFEGYEHDGKYTRESEQYSEKAFVMARAFAKHAILRPPGGLEDVVAWLYVPHELARPEDSLLAAIVQRGKELIEKSEEARRAGDDRLLDSAGGTDNDTRVFLRPLSRGAAVMLKRTIAELQEQLDQLCAANAAETAA